MGDKNTKDNQSAERKASLSAPAGSASPLCDAVVKDGYHYAMTDMTTQVVPAETARELEATLREASNLLAFLHGAFRWQLKPKDHERMKQMHVRIRNALCPQNVESTREGRRKP